LPSERLARKASPQAAVSRLPFSQRVVGLVFCPVRVSSTSTSVLRVVSRTVSVRSSTSLRIAISSVAMLVVSLYFLVLLPLEARWWHRRRFRLRPDADAQLEYALSGDGISARAEGLAESRSAWTAVFKVLRTPAGFLVYPNEQVMYWLPRDGFTSAGAMEALDVLFRAKVPRYASL